MKSSNEHRLKLRKFNEFSLPLLEIFNEIPRYKRSLLLWFNK